MKQRLIAHLICPILYLPHPKYNKKGQIPAYEMIKFSVNIHRGCFGGCSFCAIAAHQGKQIISRSEESILKEIEKYPHCLISKDIFLTLEDHQQICTG